MRVKQFISDDDEINIRKELEIARSLPAICYTSQEFFSLEEKYILRKNWICVGRESQIHSNGDYFTIDILSDPLVIVREKDNNIGRYHVFVNIDGWKLLKVKKYIESFKCPYHGWMYDLTGKLRATPGMDIENLINPNVTYLPLRVEIWQRFYFCEL